MAAICPRCVKSAFASVLAFWYPWEMNISIEVPDTIARQMGLADAHAGRRTLEILAMEGYRSGDLSRAQVSELLNLSLWETEALLKEHDCGLGLTVAEYEQSLAGC